MKEEYINEINEKIEKNKDSLEVAKEIFSTNFFEIRNELINKYETKIKTLEEIKEKILKN